jgi:lipoprotein-anchoring transpeptidase ErfK/SrfK
MTRAIRILSSALSAAAFYLVAYGAEVPPTQGSEQKPAAVGAEVTLVGNVFCNSHTAEKKEKVYFMALDGTPEIKAEFDSIVEKYYPDKGLDAEAAKALAEQFDARLRYNVDGPCFAKLRKEVVYTGRSPYTLTGVASVRDGVKWFTVSSYAPKGRVHWPAKMLVPDKPLVMPGKPPLVLKISDALSLKCIYVGPGKFLQGEPYYMIKSWQEDPPHLVTLTKGYYIAEIPITWELYQAVIGIDARKHGEDPQSAANLSCANVYNFCQLLSKSSGRKVRPPSSAELVYAYRVGTSNPPFLEKYSGKGIVADGTAPVKATRPNAWGIYEWMCDYGWERTGDLPVSEHKDVVDPRYIPPADSANPTRDHKCSHAGFGQSGYEIGEFEYINGDAGPGGKKGYSPSTRERIVVEEETNANDGR